MKLKIFKYRLAYKKPFILSKGTFNYREGFILRAKEGSVKAFGEVAPLDLFSIETLQQAESQILQNLDAITEFIQMEDSEEAYQFMESQNFCPSLEFGVDTLRHDFQTKKFSKPWTDFFPQINSEQIEINAVLGSDQLNQSMKRFRELVERGYETIKIKVGVQEAKELELVQLIRQEDQDIKIRLDANAAWDVNSALHWIDQFSEHTIEFIEQPVSTIPEMKEVVKNSSVKIAADESVRNYEEAAEIIKENAAHILAIKPMLFGHFNRLAVTKELSDSHKIELVLTSAIESGIGVRMCSILACIFGSKLMAHGFSTDTLFIEDLLKRSPVQLNKFTFPQDFGLGIEKDSINLNHVEEVIT